MNLPEGVTYTTEHAGDCVVIRFSRTVEERDPRYVSEAEVNGLIRALLAGLDENSAERWRWLRDHDEADKLLPGG